MFGMNFIPNESMYGEKFYESTLNGKICTRYFLGDINSDWAGMISRKIDRIGVGGDRPEDY